MPRSALTACLMLSLTAGLLGGCAVGPNFVRPAAPTVAAYPDAALPRGAGQSVMAGADVPGRWWSLFGSSALDGLVAQALRANPDLAAARAALTAARDNALAQRGALFPSVGADYTATRQQASGTPAPPLSSNNNIFTLHTAQVTVSYMPDLFGGARRQFEVARAQEETQRFETEAAFLTLTNSVVSGAIQEAALAKQIAAIRMVIKAETEVLDTFRRQRALGQISGLDVAGQESVLAQAETSLPPLEKQLALQGDQLAYLTGRSPGEEAPPPLDLDTLSLPASLPVSLPAQLVAHRPDVRAAEASLHAASAQVGVAIANRLPNVTLTAAAGGASTALSNLFTQGNGFWGLTADVAQPIFQGGALYYRQKAAEAALIQARAQYRAAVLGAMQNVSDTLWALRLDGEGLLAAERSERAARATLDITHVQFARGSVNGAGVLLAEAAFQQAVTARLQAQANQYLDTVALFQALGGGWWSRGDNV